MGVALTRYSKRHRIEGDSVRGKIKDRLFTIGVIIFLTVFFSVIFAVILPNWGPPATFFPFIEIIRIKSTPVVKSAHAYFVTINFINAGATNTQIDSVLLNGVPYNDPGWMGTIKPLVFGDITPNTWINTSVQYDPNPPVLSGIIIFSDDCKAPNGNKLIVGGYDVYRQSYEYYVNVTIHTISGKDYDTSVILPQSPILEISQTSPSPLIMFLSVVMAVMALTALFIMVRKWTRTGVIKHDSSSLIDR